MKFSDGFWQNQNKYDVNYMSQVYETEFDKNSITILATPSIIYNRAMTLGGSNLEIKFSSHVENIIKVNIVHHKGKVKNSPHFELNDNNGFIPTIIDKENYIELISDKTKVKIHKGQKWLVEYFYEEKLLTNCGWRSTSYIKENKINRQVELMSNLDESFWAHKKNTDSSFLREQLSLDVDECIYGFGEKFTPFVKNGQSVEIWNSDGGTCTYQSYKSIPFYISSKNYGVFVNSSDYISFEVASDTVSRVSFTLEDECLEYFIIGGKNLKEVIKNYTFLTGKPALPPAYTFGLWLSTSFVTTYDEETVTHFTNEMKRRNLPLQVFHFDCFWMKEYEWSNFKWDKNQFPEPEKFLKKLKSNGLSISVWINPYIAQRSEMFDEGMQNEYFLKNLDGSVFQCDMWQPGMAIVDFTNPSACNWFKEKLRKLLEMGVDCLKTDFGERIPTNIKYYNNSNSTKMHNYYTFLYNKTVFSLLEEYYGKNKACLFSRSATVGCHQFPVHWGGDCTAEYTSMAETLRGGLSLCSSGFGFFSHDIGGFEATATPDLYKRWCAFGLLSTHSRLHGNSTYRVPWLFDEEACDVLRFFTNLKGKLMPYIYSNAVYTAETGIPLMRPMIMEFTNDYNCLHLDKQYMLGENILVSPIFNEKGIAHFYLPKGKWIHLLSEKEYEGEKFISKYYDYFSLPLFVRENSIIAFGNFKDNFDYDYLENTRFVLYNINSKSKLTLYNSNNEKVFTIKAEFFNNELKISHTKVDKPFSISIAGYDILLNIPENSEKEIYINLK